MLCGQCFSEIAGADVCPVCGFDNAEQRTKYPVALRPGAILNGQYVVGRVLGQGGFGITYLAQDDRTKTRVAIKEYYPAEFAARVQGGTMIQVLSGNREENFAYGKEQFLEEARTLAAVRGDEHIVRIYSYFEENGTAYFAMEYVQGVPLDKFLRERGGQLTAAEAENLFLPLMAALETVHKKGIVHRDIAPDNIIVTKDGTAKLIDFGAARYSTGEKSKSLDVILKHGFAPMEQYTRRGRQGPWTDVYALAATYYYAITGKVPPDAIDRMEQDDLVAPTTLGVKMEPEAEEALLKGLELNAQDRWQSMADFAAAMRAPSLRAAEEAERERLERERREKEAAEKAERDRLAREAKEEKARQKQAAKAETERKKAEQKARSKQQKEPVKTAEAEGTRKRSSLALILAAAAVIALVITGAAALGGKKPASPAVTQPTAAAQSTAAEQGEEQKPADGTPIKLGYIGDLSGFTAPWGNAGRYGAELAVEEINAAGGVLGGRPLELIARDGKGEGADSVNALHSLISDEGIVASVGTNFSSCNIPMASVADQLEVPIVATAASNELVTIDENGNLHPYSFRLASLDSYMGEVLGNVAAKDFGLTRGAVVTVLGDTNSETVGETAKEAFIACGGAIVSEQRCPEKEMDFRTQLAAIKAADPDVIFVIMNDYARIVAFAQQAREMGLDCLLMGHDGWDSLMLAAETQGALEGCMYVSRIGFSKPDARAFGEKISARYDVGLEAECLYGRDGVYWIADAIERAGSDDPKAIRDALESTRTFEGLLGKRVLNPVTHNPDVDCGLYICTGDTVAYAGRIDAETKQIAAEEPAAPSQNAA